MTGPSIITANLHLRQEQLWLKPQPLPTNSIKS